jgi:ubiquinone/menaquinone biosynthesis C-methylase UbiE
MVDRRRTVDIAAAYDRWAEVYDVDANATRDLAAAALRGARLDVNGREVLEIGCGTGTRTRWLAEHGAGVLALDFSTEMLRRARSRVRSPRVRFLQHDVRCAWPLAAGSVDLVIGALVLEHVADLEPIFAESVRVLRPAGELFVCELHPLRQSAGRRAEFTDPGTGQRVSVTAFPHGVSEYVSTAARAGLALAQMSEWHDPDAPAGALPRLLSLHFQRGATEPVRPRSEP